MLLFYCGSYSSKAPAAPTYVFLIDVGKQSVDSGMIEIVSAAIKEIISKNCLSGDRTQVKACSKIF